MLANGPDERPRLSSERRGFPGIIGIISIAILILILGGGAFLWLEGDLDLTRRSAAVPSPYGLLYAALDIPALPPTVENQPAISVRLEELSQEKCDMDAVFGLARALQAAGLKRDAADVLLHSGRACGNKNGLLYQAADIFYGLADFAAAKEITDDLTAQWPEIPQFHYLAGRNLYAAGNYPASISEFRNTIEVQPDKKLLVEEVFLDLARAYVKFGEPCDAANAVRMWISYDPLTRDTEANRGVAADYLGQASCPSDYAAGSAVFRRNDENVILIHAIVNRTAGTFIVDTGASMTTVSSAFAKKAGILDAGTQSILLRSANGLLQARPGTAGLIKVGHLHASDVATAILPPSGQGLQPGVDGLLGMSFLSRFTLRMTSDSIVLSSEPESAPE